jgi:hypothetical protein
MSEMTAKVTDSYTLAGEEIAAMFRVDLPHMTDSELVQVLLRLRSPELEYVRTFLEPITREELNRRRIVAVPVSRHVA